MLVVKLPSADSNSTIPLICETKSITTLRPISQSDELACLPGLASFREMQSKQQQGESETDTTDDQRRGPQTTSISTIQRRSSTTNKRIVRDARESTSSTTSLPPTRLPPPSTPQAVALWQAATDKLDKHQSGSQPDQSEFQIKHMRSPSSCSSIISSNLAPAAAPVVPRLSAFLDNKGQPSLRAMQQWLNTNTTSSDSNVVVGRAIPNSPTSSAQTLNTHNARARFMVPLYIDDVPNSVGCFVVWSFRKMAKVKVSEREPFFTAKRGYYGVVTSSLSTSLQSDIYYEVNTVIFVNIVKTDMPNDSSKVLARVRYRMYHDRRGLPTIAKYVLEVDVESSRDYQSVHIISYTIKIDGRPAKSILMRHLDESIGHGARGVPSLMFSPHTFVCATKPNYQHMTFKSTKRFSNAVWSAMNVQTAADWARYSKLKHIFDNEYCKQLRGATLVGAPRNS